MSDDPLSGLVGAYVADVLGDKAARKWRWVRWLRYAGGVMLFLVIALLVLLSLANP
ncbi:hypothetical protein [Aromatoleum toluclasticum]|uniref:hypothetical protein n=1 Tax=Aromatoleum toluclasticum TaxID=92003 RepID=UPI0003637724|nr:hypothetical protein [Aromatoleum toluclasticum]